LKYISAYVTHQSITEFFCHFYITEGADLLPQGQFGESAKNVWWQKVQPMFRRLSQELGKANKWSIFGGSGANL